MSSLTKSFSGYADLLAGSAVLNPCARNYQSLKARFDSLHSDSFFAGDAEVLESNSRDYLERQAKLNDTAASLAEHLNKRSLDGSSGIAKSRCRIRGACILNSCESSVAR